MQNSSEKKLVRIITGPTAGGKSVRALECADSENGVIVNSDSMQLYDALHILSASPESVDLACVDHKLYSVLSPNEQCSAASWRKMAISEINEIHERDALPIICGGTGFYILALLEGLSPIPDIPDEVRTKITKMGQELNNCNLHEELARRDPESAKRINPNDSQRVQRALEVLEHTGKPLSYWQSLPKNSPPDDISFSVEVIMRSKSDTRERIEKRFHAMIKNGVIDEVENFNEAIKQGKIASDVAITNALGYRNISDYLEGVILREEMIEKTVIETGQYAKRQSTWIRGILAKATQKAGIEIEYIFQ